MLVAPVGMSDSFSLDCKTLLWQTTDTEFFQWSRSASVDKCIHLTDRLVTHSGMFGKTGQKLLFKFLQRVLEKVEASLVLVKRGRVPLYVN